MDAEAKAKELTEEVTKTSDIKVFAPSYEEFTLGGDGLEKKTYKLYPPKLLHMELIEELENTLNGMLDGTIKGAFKRVIEILSDYLNESDKDFIGRAVGIEQLTEFLYLNGKLNLEGFRLAGLKVSDKKKT